MSTLLNTSAIHPLGRVDYWTGGIAEHFFETRFSPLGPRPFEGWMKGSQVGPITIRAINGSPHRIARRPTEISQSDPEHILLYLARQGQFRIGQDEQKCVLTAGDMGIQDTSRPSVVESPGNLSLFVLSFPKQLLGPRADHISQQTAQRLSAQKSPFVQLAAPFVARLANAAGRGDLSSHESEGAFEMLLTILQTVHSGTDGIALARHSQRKTMLSQLRAYALEHLHEADLGPERLAQAHYISVRYVHRLFAASGTGVAEWIRTQRLEKVMKALQDPALATTPIASIAISWGFTDPSSFSRSFRQYFGKTPTMVRKEHLEHTFNGVT